TGMHFTPVQVSRTHDRAVYNVKVYGIGFLKALTWHVIYTTIDTLGDEPPITFRTADEAYRACLEDPHELLKQSPGRFAGSRCVNPAPHTPDGSRYYYAIESRNPFAW